MVRLFQRSELANSWAGPEAAAGVTRDDLSAASLNNLCRLGLCESPVGAILADPRFYEPLEAESGVLQDKAKVEAAGHKLGFGISRQLD